VVDAYGKSTSSSVMATDRHQIRNNTSASGFGRRRTARWSTSQVEASWPQIEDSDERSCCICCSLAKLAYYWH